MDMGFAITGPLARHDMPEIRFLFIGPRLCLALLSDDASRRRPWVRLSFTSIRLDRDFHPELSNMLGTPTLRPSGANFVDALRVDGHHKPRSYRPSGGPPGGGRRPPGPPGP